ncbi:MAG: type II toxin-antitoxin system VapC family toxin [Burkholderiales bacterium]|nr:type II toxin-antitoxin system VapC family toxin [Burkholderiales bacterium]
MILLDSNIIIYAMNPDLPQVAGFLEGRRCFASEITRLEVMGYHRLTNAEYALFESFFANIELLHVSSNVIDQATLLRRKRNIGTGDAIIAATALIHRLSLVTRNVKDFAWIGELVITDPLKSV